MGAAPFFMPSYWIFDCVQQAFRFSAGFLRKRRRGNLPQYLGKSRTFFLSVDNVILKTGEHAENVLVLLAEQLLLDGVDAFEVV